MSYTSKNRVNVLQGASTSQGRNAPDIPEQSLDGHSTGPHRASRQGQKVKMSYYGL
jgi:hypothetical protein